MSQRHGAMAQTAGDYEWNSVAIGGGGFVSAIITSKKEKDLMYARTDVGGAYRWNASTSTWIPLLDWCSEDELGYQGVEALAIDPQSPNKVYMLVGTSYFSDGRTAILRSEDYGNTFTIIDVTSQFKAHGNGMGRQAGEKLVVDPNNSNILYCGTRWNGLFKSTDAGTTWSRLNSLSVTTTPNENGISFVVLDGSSVSGGATQRIIVGVSRSGSTNLYRSDDGGQSFSAVSGATTTYMPHRAALASDGDVYITYGNGAGPHGSHTLPEPMSEGQIWKYNVSSGAWTDITPSGYNMAFGGVCVDPNNPERLVASTINAYWTQYENTNSGKDVHGDRIFLSTNGGTSWVDVVDRGFTLDTDGITWVYGHSIHWAGSIEFDPFNTERVWITSGNGLFVNDNISSSDTWRFSVRGIEETVSLGLVSIPNGPVISVIGDYDGFRHTDVTQYAPIHNPQMGTTTGLAVAAQNTSKIVRVGNSMYYSTDMGLTWTQSNMNGDQGKVALSADGNTVLHSPRKSSTTYRSTDNGSSWSTVSGLDLYEALPVGDPVNSNKFYAYNPENGEILVSTDGGSSFAPAGSVAKGGSKVIRVAPDREGDLWVALNDGGLARSTNSGQSFSAISGISNCGAVGFGIAASGADYPTIFIWGTINNVRGLYRSTDQGASWVRVNDDEHEYGGPGNGQYVVGDMNKFGTVYMSTAGRGIVVGDARKYTLTTSSLPSTGGTVSGAGTYVFGTEVTVTATPASGYAFTGWSGDVTGTDATITITMDGDKSVTANFEAIEYTLTTTASPTAGGTVSGGGTYTSGGTATVTATPASGYAFTGWSGDATGTGAAITITMDDDKSVTANFEAIKYTLTTTSSPTTGGTVSGGGTYTFGSTATLTATAATGYTFTGWSGDATGTDASITITMDGDKSVTANFEAIEYTLTTASSPSAGGTVSGDGTYTFGSTAILTATAATGYAFTGWSGDATGTSSSITITMDGDKSVTANFELIPPNSYTLTTVASPLEGGTVAGGGTYEEGTEVELIATPATGYAFTGWSGDATGTSSSITLTMDGDKSVTANFELTPQNSYTLTTVASPLEGGTVAGGGTYEEGTEVELIATPAAGYAFTGWSGDAIGTSSSITITIDSDKSVTANFELTPPNSYTLTTTASPLEGGTVAGAGMYKEGTEVELIATPAIGYTFTGWSGDATGTSASITVIVNSDMAVQANFSPEETDIVRIPKLFSPDNQGDLSTETWNIENAHLLDGGEVIVFNRQGQKVYSSLGYAMPWDGTFNGQPLPGGAYYYIITYSDNKKQTGSVTIARLK